MVRQDVALPRMAGAAGPARGVIGEPPQQHRVRQDVNGRLRG